MRWKTEKPKEIVKDTIKSVNTTVKKDTDNKRVFTGRAQTGTYTRIILHATTCVCWEGEEIGDSINNVKNLISGI